MLAESWLELLSIVWSFLLIFLSGRLYYSLVFCGKYRSVEFAFTLPAYALSIVSCIKKVGVLALSLATGKSYLDLSYLDALFEYGNMYVIFYMGAIWVPLFLRRRKHAMQYLKLQALLTGDPADRS